MAMFGGLCFVGMTEERLTSVAVVMVVAEKRHHNTSIMKCIVALVERILFCPYE